MTIQHNIALEITFVVEAGLLWDTCICKPFTASKMYFFRDPFLNRISGSFWKQLKWIAFKHVCHITLKGFMNQYPPCIPSPYNRINPGLKREILFWFSFNPLSLLFLKNMSFSNDIWLEESIISVHCFACSKVIWFCINNPHFTISHKLRLNAYVLNEIAYFMKECLMVQMLCVSSYSTKSGDQTKL